MENRGKDGKRRQKKKWRNCTTEGRESSWKDEEQKEKEKRRQGNRRKRRQGDAKEGR